MSEPLWQPRTDLAARLLGAGFLGGGCALLAYQATVIVNDAAAHAASVSYSLAAIALGAMGTLVGAYWLASGLDGYTAIRTMQTDRRRMRTFAIVAAVVLMATTVALKLWLASLGYDD